MSMQWFILSTFTGQESKVKKELENWRNSKKEFHDLIGEILVPQNQNGTVFPGYAFAELDAYENYSEGKRREKFWNAVCKIDGMIGFLGGDFSRPMSEDELNSLRKHCEQIVKEKKVEFKEGDSVKILDGAFTGNDGTIVKISDGIAIVKVEIFGEETEQEIPVGSLEKQNDND